MAIAPHLRYNPSGGRATRVHSDVFPIRRLVTAFRERARAGTMKLNEHGSDRMFSVKHASSLSSIEVGLSSVISWIRISLKITCSRLELTFFKTE